MELSSASRSPSGVEGATVSFSSHRGRGLSRIPSEELRRLLRLSYQGALPSPLRRSDLLVRGLNLLAEEGELLIGLEQGALNAVLIAVLAERSAGPRLT